MTTKKHSELFLSWAGQKAPAVLLYLCCTAIFTLVLFLYRIPGYTALYAAALCLPVILVYLTISFLKFCRKYREVSELTARVTLCDGRLPQASSLMEQQYLDNIRILWENQQSQITGFECSRRDMIDYYTIWVHQIKTPIAAMNLLLQSVPELSGPDLSGELFKIEQYADMALQYQRLDSPSGDFIFRRMDLDDILKQAVRKYSKTFIGRKIRLEYLPLELRVLTDEKWMVFVVEQLLSNALKYTRKGCVRIYPGKVSPMSFVIEDTGIGIAPEDLPRIFEKGYTGYNGHQDKKATGLGLYLCKKILDRLSHTITIKSEIGRGTKVIIDMSCAEPPCD